MNELRVFNLRTDIQQPLYGRMLHFAAVKCVEATLVVRREQDVGNRARLVLDRLAKYLQQHQIVSTWPGTVLMDGTAMLYRFRLSNETADLLTRSASSVFAWLHPDLPEDLCLIRENGDPWLTTIAHECDGFFRMTEDEFIEFVQHVPGIAEHIIVSG